MDTPSLPTPEMPPEPIFSDYVEMTSLVLMFIIGAPLNLAAYTQLAERPLSSRLDLLKRHLNYADLLVLFVYVPSRACWLLTYDWRGGDLLCKIVKMMHTFAFQSSSNIIVCIGLDRLFSVFSASHQSPAKAQRRIRIMLATGKGKRRGKEKSSQSQRDRQRARTNKFGEPDIY
uniref:G_PROTEIN_RECEP_F1_2 domain-containing protein n=1 Tax=Heterorhabditis bacteriophora TaxID=37862 RepID=A0A1I7WML1_HETBA